ncbi:hypothetical protein MARCHEWKA_00800 [Brevundimonas phage vB_BpoS-Marchewka]|uniref:Uncharacterized protein n=1 Tax=Brevundimonas phage vB_BpoS-Marchewka TaxID=2948604 RepID=A0A9E7SQS4_9CAUD|nr:hypothetical protein MARCHEWKA_00800 [Brevundimonas phage vB_BpoS-Marchewka]
MPVVKSRSTWKRLMPEPAELNLDDYVRRLHAEVDAFAVKWRAMHAINAEHWPATMHEADWDEQFIAETM